MIYYTVNFNISMPLSILCEKRDLWNCIHKRFVYDSSSSTPFNVLYPVEVVRIFAKIGFMTQTYKASEYEFMKPCLHAE